jgi:hypothetical protein
MASLLLRDMVKKLEREELASGQRYHRGLEE